jgi:hypothetical protein
LDYFIARYYSGAQGRFTSPDEFTGGPDELYDFADDASDNPTFYADLTDPQSLNKYQYCYNQPLVYVDLDGHKGIKEHLKEAAQTVGEFAGGVVRGAAASISFGALPEANPKESDSLASRLGQAVGTGIVGGVGTGLATGSAVGGILTSPTGVGAVAGAAGVVGGLAMAGGAVKNGVAVITTPMERRATPKPGSQGGPGAGKPFSEATRDAARAESGNKCVFCGVTTTRRRGPRQSQTDHAIPKSRGGNNTVKNAQNTCRTCNLDKRATTTREYQRELKRRKEEQQ